MRTHNDFRSLAETQVKSPQHLKLDTSLLRHRTQTAVLQYVQKMKTTLSTRVLTKAVSPNPSASHYKLKEFVDSL